MKNNMNYYDLSSKSKKEILSIYKTNEKGLSHEEVLNRLDKYGENNASIEKKKSIIYFIIQSFKDKFILILLLLAIIDYITNDKLGTIIILLIALISSLLRFVQDYSTYKFNDRLKEKLRIYTDVMRDNKQEEIMQKDIVLGDIVTLSAGSVVPADLYLIYSKDLFINQSIFTGESIPVEKNCLKKYKNKEDIFSIDNICYMGSNVISGTAIGVVVKTGLDTFMGSMNKNTDAKKESTPFSIGMDKITSLLIKYMVVISILVFIIYGFIRKDLKEALLFSLSVAVGITPSMLPMIVNVNLTRGSKNLAKKKTLVKNISSIQNLGSMDILCTDKTGTLTENNIVLQKYINIHGEDDEYVLKCAYLNSSLGTGFKNIVDKAVVNYGKNNNIDITDYQKIDEIPFDYSRKRMSVVVSNNQYFSIITKGALEEIFKVCDMALIDGNEKKLDKEIIKLVSEKEEELSRKGMQVIALAVKHEYSGIDKFDIQDEKDLTLIGLIAFLDEPKKDAKVTIDKLKSLGVTTKILTGDNIYSTTSICDYIGINSKILTGNDIENMHDKELSKIVEEVDVYARMNPLQKARIVSILKNNGHCVGYMGDGVNDAPSLSKSDVGISVMEGTDIAKEYSDIILLKQGLDIIYDGVIEGRKVYGNIVKYMKLALSQDFGDVFSILISSICLPFLPLLPIQMLIQDFIVEISQIGIPYDNVDEEFIKSPKKWDTKNLSKFMKLFGVISSITDVVAFLIFWYVLGYNDISNQAYFQTAWFVECIISETLIIYYLRTNKLSFIKSNPSKILIALTLVTTLATIFIPILLSSLSEFNFVILPGVYYIYLLLLTLMYALIVQIVKRIYIKKYNEWL